MTEETAKGHADSSREKHGVPEEYSFDFAARRIIELEAGASKVRDCRVWIVRYTGDPSWVELAVDESNGDIVRVVWSR